MKFEDVQKLHDQLDCKNSWHDEDHFGMQVYARTESELLVVRLGGYNNQAYLYRLPADHPVPTRYDSLNDGDGIHTGIPICCFENGLLYGGENYYDLPDGYEPYDPNSGEAGVLDVNMDQDWKLSDIEYLERVAEKHLVDASYELECSQKALAAIRNN